jgi:parallel beta-helix repeat protein
MKGATRRNVVGAAVLAVVALTVPVLAPAHAASPVVIAPGASIQQAIDANPAGTVFQLQAGTWTLSSTLVPKDGDVFTGAGEGQTVITGTAGINGFDSKSKVSNVVVSQLTVKGFADGIRTGTGWIVDGVEAAFNEIGIHMYGDDAVVRNSYAHDNGVFGVHGTRSTGQQLLSSEVSYNHTDSSVSSGYSGGAKWVYASGLVIQGNNIHDNYGNGLWLDNETSGALVSANTVRGNEEDGLRLEISHDNVIQSNQVSANGGQAIDLVNSRDNVVTGNTISGPSSQDVVFRMIGNGRVDDAGNEYVNAGNRADHNTITLVSTSQQVGVIRSAGTTYGNSFDANTYVVPSPSAAYFKWWDGSTNQRVDWSTWRGTYGQDLNGALGGTSAPPPAPPTITSFLPTSGPVGTLVTISGSGFTGATSVAFNGTAAPFTVVSSSTITATVPAGATSGPVSVTGPNGAAQSSGSFSVTAATSGGSISRVASLGSVANGSSATNTLSLTVGRTVAVGDRIVLGIGARGAVRVSSIVDSRGNVYRVDAVRATSSQTAPKSTAVIATAGVATALKPGDVITVTVSQGKAWGFAAEDWTGITKLDQVGGADSGETTGSAVAVGSAGPTTGSPEVVFAVTTVNSAPGIAAGAGFTETVDLKMAQGGATREFALEYAVVSSSGVQTATFGLGAAKYWVGALATYR